MGFRERWNDPALRAAIDELKRYFSEPSTARAGWREQRPGQRVRELWNNRPWKMAPPRVMPSVITEDPEPSRVPETGSVPVNPPAAPEVSKDMELHADKLEEEDMKEIDGLLNDEWDIDCKRFSTHSAVRSVSITHFTSSQKRFDGFGITTEAALKMALERKNKGSRGAYYPHYKIIDNYPLDFTIERSPLDAALDTHSGITIRRPDPQEPITVLVDKNPYSGFANFNEVLQFAPPKEVQ